jgi:hypothetical protein
VIWKAVEPTAGRSALGFLALRLLLDGLIAAHGWARPLAVGLRYWPTRERG